VIAIETQPVSFDQVRARVQETQHQERRTLDAFHRLSYHGYTWSMAKWMGVPMLKHPCDALMLQELIARVRPALIVETGTAMGGSALFLGHVCDAIGHGAIITIDIEPDVKLQHPRVTYRIGSSVDPEIVRYVADRAARCGGPVLVILDSDHHEAHVAAELRCYAPLVTVDSYLIVEDTNVNGRPVLPEFGPGPHEAVEAWLTTPTEGPVFARDALAERYLITMHPGGWLRRIR
jgi:cephalosporin hydroxylase